MTAYLKKPCFKLIRFSAKNITQSVNIVMTTGKIVSSSNNITLSTLEALQISLGEKKFGTKCLPWYLMWYSTRDTTRDFILHY